MHPEEEGLLPGPREPWDRLLVDSRRRQDAVARDPGDGVEPLPHAAAVHHVLIADEGARGVALGPADLRQAGELRGQRVTVPAHAVLPRVETGENARQRREGVADGSHCPLEDGASARQAVDVRGEALVSPDPVHAEGIHGDEDNVGEGGALPDGALAGIGGRLR